MAYQRYTSNLVNNSNSSLFDCCGRHNPHPNRVTHFKGLLDLPVRIIYDPIPNKNVSENDSNQKLPYKTVYYPIGLSPSYYTDCQLDSNFDLPKLRNEESNQNRFPHSNHHHRIPVGLLSISQPRRRIPQLDTINSLKYFTGLQNYSIRDQPTLVRSLIQCDRSKLNSPRCSELNNLSTNNLQSKKWRNELGYLTGTILNQLQSPVKNNELFQNTTNLSNSRRFSSHFREVNCDKSVTSDMIPYISTPGGNYSFQTGRLIPTNRMVRRSQSIQIPLDYQQTPQNYTIDDMFRLYEIQIFNLIGSILQTADVNAIQQWLENSTDREKNLVISLLTTALSNQSNLSSFKSNETQNHSNINTQSLDLHADNKFEQNTIFNQNASEYSDQLKDSTFDRLVLDDKYGNNKETHSRGIQTNESNITSIGSQKMWKPSETFIQNNSIHKS